MQMESPGRSTMLLNVGEIEEWCYRGGIERHVLFPDL
jgi:hypothetical protein